MAAQSPTLSDASAAGFSGILKQQPSPENAPTASTAASFNHAFDKLIQQSGSHHTTQQWLLACIVLATAFGVMVFAATFHLLLTAAGFVAGGTIPLTIATTKKSIRHKRIVEQLPAMVESISRNTIAGHNFESALSQTAQQTESPLAEELQHAVSEIRMGITPASAIGELGKRTGVVELSMFSSAVSLHQNHGGNLATMLERFSVSVRDRLHFENRMRAATIATRLGTTLMLGLPPCIVAYYSFQNPDYLGRLLSSSIGRLSVIVAVVLQVIGAVSVYRILKDSTQQYSASR